MTDPWQDKAEHLLSDLEKDHPQEFFHALRTLIDERFPRGRRRPGGKDSVDDSARLDRLVELLRDGVEEQKAVQQVAHDDPGNDEKNRKTPLGKPQTTRGPKRTSVSHSRGTPSC